MASDFGGFFQERSLLLRVWVGLGQDLRRSLMLNGEVDRESHLFLWSGPPLAKAWDENLGVKVGGLGSGGALLGPLTAKAFQNRKTIQTGRVPFGLKSLSWTTDREDGQEISSSYEPSLFKNLHVEISHFSFGRLLASFVRRVL